MKVLITTSGIGSRLGELTKFTNKSLVALGDKPVICHIVDSYPTNAQFVITLGHFGEHVRDFLELVYPERIFEFVTVDNYSGAGSSLAFSMLHAKHLLMEPFIFHASDTIVSQTFGIQKTNWVGGFVGKNGSDYSTFDVFQNKVSRIHAKGMDFFDFIYVGLAGIFNYELFWDELGRLYSKSPFDPTLNDLSAISKMVDLGTPFEFFECPTWIDSGNISSLKRAQDGVSISLPTLPKHDESIFLIDKKVVKFFADKSVCTSRVLRAKILDDLVPKISSVRPNFYSYEYVSGRVASRMITAPVFENLLSFLDSNLWDTPDHELREYEFQTACFEFYFEKTRVRIENFFAQTGIKDKEELINGLIVPKVEDLLSTAKAMNIHFGTQGIIHGDLILDNIIINENSFKLIDWRHEFSGHLYSGDTYYDYAKLNHSLILSHDILLTNGFILEDTNDGLYVDVNRSDNLMMCQSILSRFLRSKGASTEKVRVLTSIVWLNMSPLHHYPLNKFLFYFGKLNLMKALNDQ